MDPVIRKKLPITQDACRWWYGCWIERIIDGDSYVIKLDLGRRVYQEGVVCRGHDYDTWETRRRPSGIDDQEWQMHKALGQRATAAVKQWMPKGAFCMVNTFRDDTGKYGRLLVRIYRQIETGWIDIYASLKAGGHLKRAV